MEESHWWSGGVRQRLSAERVRRSLVAAQAGIKGFEAMVTRRGKVIHRVRHTRPSSGQTLTARKLLGSGSGGAGGFSFTFRNSGPNPYAMRCFLASYPSQERWCSFFFGRYGRTRSFFRHRTGTQLSVVKINVHLASNPKLLDAQDFKSVIIDLIVPFQPEKSKLGESREFHIRQVEQDRNPLPCVNDRGFAKREFFDDDFALRRAVSRFSICEDIPKGMSLELRRAVPSNAASTTGSPDSFKSPKLSLMPKLTLFPEFSPATKLRVPSCCAEALKND